MTFIHAVVDRSTQEGRFVVQESALHVELNLTALNDEICEFFLPKNDTGLVIFVDRTSAGTNVGLVNEIRGCCHYENNVIMLMAKIGKQAETLNAARHARCGGSGLDKQALEKSSS
jgi:hypothetical protein